MYRQVVPGERSIENGVRIVSKVIAVDKKSRLDIERA
jgi:hypothetical protein